MQYKLFLLFFTFACLLYRLPDTFGKQGKWLATLQKLLVEHIPIPAKCESLLSQLRTVSALTLYAKNPSIHDRTLGFSHKFNLPSYGYTPVGGSCCKGSHLSGTHKPQVNEQNRSVLHSQNSGNQNLDTDFASGFPALPESTSLLHRNALRPNR